MSNNKFKVSLRELLSFSRSESRGILLLLPLLIIIGILISTINTPSIEKSFPLLADSMIDSTHNAARSSHEQIQEGEIIQKLSTFDPNTIDYRGLRRLGFSQQSAAALINYRTKYQKVFELSTDFAACYQVTDSIFDRLEPYIVIDPRFKSKPKARNSFSSQTERVAKNNDWAMPVSQSIELFMFDPNILDSIGFCQLGFSPRQAAVILKYRDQIGGFKSIESFGKCYCVTERLEELRPYIKLTQTQPVEKAKPAKLDLNSATREQLIELPGIGELTANRIIEYRDRLGGFYDIRQLWEVEGVMERNFEHFSKEIYVDNSRIIKIDINFAPADAMEDHPYMSSLIIRKALKYKQLEGGLRSIEEMINGKILSKVEAEKLSHYLVFTPFTPE